MIVGVYAIVRNIRFRVSRAYAVFDGRGGGARGGGEGAVWVIGSYGFETPLLSPVLSGSLRL